MLYQAPPTPFLLLQTSILGKVKDILALPRDDASKDDKIKALRTDINGWVATYRREPRTSGRPSYGRVNLGSGRVYHR